MCEYGGIIKIKELFDLSTRNSRHRGISIENLALDEFRLVLHDVMMIWANIHK